MRDLEAIAKKLHKEGMLPLSKAAKLVPAERGRRGYVSTETLIRWILRGKEGVKLEAIRGAGSTWYTSQEALARFMATISAIEIAKRQRMAAAPTLSQWQRRVDAAVANIEGD